MCFHIPQSSMFGELFSTWHGWLLFVENLANAQICGLCPESNTCQRCPKLGHIKRTAELKVLSVGTQKALAYELVKLRKDTQVLKFCQNSDIRQKIWNFAEILKFGQNSDIWPQLWNLAKTVKSGQNSEIYPKFWNYGRMLDRVNLTWVQTSSESPALASKALH